MNAGKIALPVLAALLGMVLSLHVLLQPDLLRRNYEFLPDMRTLVAYDGQGENPNYADGKNLQPPAPGAIARGFLPVHYGPGEDEARRAGAELKNPYAATDAAARARGAAVWATFCVVCHGPNAEGNGPVTRRGVPAPPSFHTDVARARKDGELFHIVTYGRNNGNMPSYAVQVGAEDRWKAILHLRGLQEAQVQKDRQAAEPPADVKKEK